MAAHYECQLHQLVAQEATFYACTLRVVSKQTGNSLEHRQQRFGAQLWSVGYKDNEHSKHVERLASSNETGPATPAKPRPHCTRHARRTELEVLRPTSSQNLLSKTRAVRRGKPAAPRLCTLPAKARAVPGPILDLQTPSRSCVLLKCFCLSR